MENAGAQVFGARRKVRALEEENQDLREKLHEQTCRHKALCAELEQHELRQLEEVDLLQDQVQQLQQAASDMEAWRAHAHHLESEKKKVDMQFRSLQQGMQMMESSVFYEKNEKFMLQAELDGLKEDHEEKVKGLEGELDDLRQQVADLQQALEKFAGDRASAQGESDSSKAAGSTEASANPVVSTLSDALRAMEDVFSRQI
uniref:Uncharacterized protein n=1 Tax=Fibrocapsa japonica TaxID=94617 RepID=A0A7S2XXV1_9STRA|mmetsp:Transcript_23110/g.33577  ORF Transcript_23110/g.33577 Transcript_23110/m.33577 type:complete len:202 (+) Transcript_23110:1-606(+)